MKKLILGNLNLKETHARDFVEAQWMILQQKNPDDYVIATGKNYSVKEFINLAKFLDIKLFWKGKGIKQKGYDDKGNEIISCSKKYYRPSEVDTLLEIIQKQKEF